MSGYIGTQPVPQATQTRQTFVATAAQTSFATAGYSVGYLDVFLNGVKLQDGVDYTATNGSDIVLTVGAALDDTLEVVAYTAFEVVNAYTKAEADAGFVAKSGDTMTGNLIVTGTVKAGNILADSSSTISVFGWQQAALSTGDGYKTVRSENGLDGYNYYASLYWQDDLKLRTTDSGIDVRGDILNGNSGTATTNIGVIDAGTNYYNASTRGDLVVKASSAVAGAQAQSGGRLFLEAGNSYNGNAGDVYIRAGKNLVDNHKAQILFQQGLVETMRIDSSGRVTTPYQPMFHALRTTHVTTSGDIAFQQVNRNVGGHYNSSNGRFTVPIAGNYLFCFSTLLYNLGYSTNARLQLNGGGLYGMSSIGTYGEHTGAYSGQGGSTIVYLNAGDYVAVNVSHAGTNLHAGYTFWSGQLIG